MSASASYFKSPASYPATKSGYNSYLRDLGIDIHDSKSILMFAIPFGKFKAMDRVTLEDLLQEASDRLDQLHEAYKMAVKNNLTTSIEMAEDGLSFWSKKWLELVRRKSAN